MALLGFLKSTTTYDSWSFQEMCQAIKRFSIAICLLLIAHVSIDYYTAVS